MAVGVDEARQEQRGAEVVDQLRGVGGRARLVLVHAADAGDPARVALELDGVPLSQQFSIGNFSNATRDLVDVGLIQRIEVLHGPASALYGSSALGGVVSMTTPEPAVTGLRKGPVPVPGRGFGGRQSAHGGCGFDDR